MKPEKVVVKTTDNSSVKVFSPTGIVVSIITVAILIIIFGSITVFTDIDDSPLFAPIVFLIIAVICLALVITALISSRKNKK